MEVFFSQQFKETKQLLLLLIDTELICSVAQLIESQFVLSDWKLP